jgi:hypothetical protein
VQDGILLGVHAERDGLDGHGAPIQAWFGGLPHRTNIADLCVLAR